jgi:hypothetical protein
LQKHLLSVPIIAKTPVVLLVIAKIPVIFQYNIAITPVIAASRYMRHNVGLQRQIQLWGLKSNIPMHIMQGEEVITLLDYSKEVDKQPEGSKEKI